MADTSKDKKIEDKKLPTAEQVVNEDSKPEPEKGTIVKTEEAKKEDKIEPPKASGFTIRQNGKATTYARKFTKPDEAKPKPDVPKFVNDLFQRINIAANIHLDEGPENITIDCQPDYRNMFLSLSYYCTKIYQDVNIKDNSLISPPSLMAYFLALIYGHALISETSNVRNTRSEFANDFTAEDTRRDLLNVIETLPTPPFIKDLITSYMPTCDPRRPGIQFVHSLASFLMLHDFGRAYPITAFIKAHTLIATTQANVDPNITFDAFYNAALLVQNDNGVLYVKNIFGTRHNQGSYPHTIVNAVETLFNPVTQRTNTVRPTFSKLITFPLDHAFDNTLNPYIYLLGADPDNVSIITNFLKSMGAHLKEELKCTDLLGSTFGSTSGTGILNHYYSPMSFPTWHVNTQQGARDIITSTAYAEAVGFMRPHDDPNGRVNITYPAPANRENLLPELYLRRVDAPEYNRANDPDATNEFSSRLNVTPDVSYFDPWDYIPSQFAHNVVNGLHIESSGISSTIVPQPHTRSGIVTNNAQFLNAAIPAHLIRRASTIDAANPFIDFQIDIGSENTQATRLTTVNIHTNRIPSFDQQVCEPEHTPVALVGFHPTQHIGRLQRMSNTIAFKHGTFEDAQTASNWPDHKINLWSSYRYFNTNLRTTTDRERKISFFANFRSYYGTNVTLADSKHPFLLIPTS